MVIYQTQVNHLTNPLGFLMDKTVFQWKVKEAGGKRQTEARIVIARDWKMEQVICDTGWDETADSLGFPVPLTLSPRTRYFWTVSVRTDAGEEATSAVNYFETAKREEAWIGKWITCKSEATQERHPYFEKKISLKKKVKNARLYVCGLGLYEVYYGDRRIGNEYLTPYSNNYNRWVQYQTWDVTEALAESGMLSVLLGNGWYRARFGFDAHEDKGFYGSEWKLIAELRIVYEDGEEETVGTDESWQVRRSRITFSNLYDGEHVDMTLPPLPAEEARHCEPPRGKLTERLSLPVRVHQVFHPAELIHTPAGETVLDLGQEIAGIFSLRIREPEGTEIHIQTGEILQSGNFYNDNLRTAKSEYIYISDGKERTVTPHFTYYGYRYVKLEGLTHFKLEDFEGWALCSDVPDRGFIKTGHELVNKLISNVRWGLKDNFLDVPTDCPQRDERMGWTGDAQVFSPTAIFLTDTWAFYRKYLYDMWQEQQEHGGMVPDVIPSGGVATTASVWGDAACIIPWNLYLFYGDPSILAEQYDSMKGWVEFIRRTDGTDHGWRNVFHYGDWLALDHPIGGAEQVKGATDEGFIANIYYAASAKIVAKAAAVLGKKDDEERYSRIAQEQFAEVKKEYYSVTGRCCIDTQTALILTLKYGLSDNSEWVLKRLQELFTFSGQKLKTGFVGTPLLCNVLSENGLDSMAYTLLLNEDYPGWLYEIRLGATTVWERWNSVKEDGYISGIGMNSLNHYSYGSIVEWIFRHAAGMDFTDAVPGCQRVTLRPAVNYSLGHLTAEYDSPAGMYRCGWEILDNMRLKVWAEVPFGCEAKIVLPESGGKVCDLSPGRYEWEYETERPLRKCYGMDTTVRELLKDPEVSNAFGSFMPLATIPEQFVDCSMSQILEIFGEHISDEQRERVEVIMAGIFEK